MVHSVSWLRFIEERLREGAPLEELLKKVSWADFEEVCSEVFVANGFRVVKRFRFKSLSRRFEIDVLALREPMAICSDCKHWGLRTGSFSSIVNVVEKQVERVRALASSLKDLRAKLGLGGWREATLIPAVIILHEKGVEFCEKVPVVPVFKLNSFIEQVLNYVPELWKVDVELS